MRLDRQLLAGGVELAAHGVELVAQSKVLGDGVLVCIRLGPDLGGRSREVLDLLG